MAATTVIVDLEQRAALDAERLVERIKAIVPAATAEADAAAESKNWVLLAAAITNHTDELLAYDNERHGDAVFLYLFASLGSFAVDAQFAEAVQSVTDRIAAASSASGERKLRLLSQLYNLTENRNGAKLHVLLRLFAVAREASMVDRLRRFLDGVESVASRWGLDKGDERSLLLSAADLAEQDGNAARAQELRCSYLQTFQGDDAAALADAQPVAVQAAVQFLASPFASSATALITLDAVKALSDDAATKPVFSLLSVFAEGTVADFTAFMATNAETLRALGISESAALRSIRLLTVASLGTDASVLALTDVAKALQVEETEAESWVLAAMEAGVVQARIDQSAGTVTISATAPRAFSDGEWRRLAEQLAAWKQEVQTVHGALRSGSAGAASMMV